MAETHSPHNAHSRPCLTMGRETPTPSCSLRSQGFGSHIQHPNFKRCHPDGSPRHATPTANKACICESHGTTEKVGWNKQVSTAHAFSPGSVQRKQAKMLISQFFPGRAWLCTLPAMLRIQFLLLISLCLDAAGWDPPWSPKDTLYTDKLLPERS